MLRRFAVIFLLAMIALASARAASVTFEAESGALGTDWAVSNSPSPAYITITSDSTTNNPVSAARVATYTVNFPTADTYQLYARIYVGAGTFNDDSMFYAASFGTKNATLNSDWVLVNGLSAAGFNNSTDVVTGGGTLGSGVWKWINLSQFTGQAGFTVSAGNLTQTFQIGARENGLNLDKFVFGSANDTFTVANLDNGTDGTPPPPVQNSSGTATIDTTKTFQTIEGMGGATAFYQTWLRDHPFKQEIYTNIFAGLNLSMLRLGDWYRYQTPLIGFDTAATDIVSNANRLLGHPVQVYMSSWSPPAFLKNNGDVANGNTLLFTNGGFAYTNFAQYWYDSLNAYQSNGVSLKWISIQNEPDWAASYDSCVFHPNEDTVNNTNYASYSKALDAVAQKLATLPSPPRILGPEPVGIGFNDVQNYAATMNWNKFLRRRAPSLPRQHRRHAGRMSQLDARAHECFPGQTEIHDRIQLHEHDRHRVPHARLLRLGTGGRIQFLEPRVAGQRRTHRPGKSLRVPQHLDQRSARYHHPIPRLVVRAELLGHETLFVLHPTRLQTRQRHQHRRQRAPDRLALAGQLTPRRRVNQHQQSECIRDDFQSGRVQRPSNQRLPNLGHKLFQIPRRIDERPNPAAPIHHHRRDW